MLTTQRFMHTTVVVLGALLATCSFHNARSGDQPVGDFGCVSTAGRYTSYDYPSPPTSGLPCNVDTNAVGQSSTLAQEQRYFDIFSWQTFVALNWPTQDGRKLQPTLTSPGDPRWTFWKESYEVYRDKGQAPTPWGTPRSAVAVCSSAGGKNAPGMVLFRTNKLASMTSNMTVADELDEAFTYPLVDQNGNLVRYEVIMNYDEFTYLNQHQLYNIDGQINFTKGGEIVNFPSGSNTDLKTGAIELKMAWKVMTDTDPAQRYYTRKAYVANENGSCDITDVGLVGMHISHKTEKNKQWVWSTFEHVDNVRANQLDTVKLRNGKEGSLRPSFNNPDCPTCPVNVLPPAEDGVLPPVQVTRVIPIKKNTAQLNGQVKALLAELGSVFQYYELVGTQWPTDENVKPASPSQFSTAGDTAYEQIANKSGGKPHPVYLINTTMETYMQYGNQKAQLQIQGFPFNETPVFGTESCMGCHFSAGVAVGSLIDDYGDRQVVYGPASSGDFSWLLQLKAQWVK